MTGPPVGAPTRELRIGLVLYGGVSLAVYMYGIVREFWHLVRAVEGVEVNAYTSALQTANVSATVDVISGTSAGGINGILLAKALATGANLGALGQFWVKRADFDGLLRSTAESGPRSLLRSDFFEEQLSDALREMDRGGTGGHLVDVLDLFVSGTRLRGMVRDYTDSLGQSVQARDYRKVFHLKFRTKGYNPADLDLGYDRNEFGPAQNTALVEIARATSAFPVAFEPKLIEKRLDNAALFEGADPVRAFFSDGGILNNKPFTETLSTIFARQSDRPVRRWLFSVEPDPEHYGTEVEPGPEPEPVEVLMKAASGIPMYQSIAADLDRLDTHNARVRSLNEQLSLIEDIITTQFQNLVNTGTPEQFRAFLKQQVLYYAYQILKFNAVVSTLTTRLTRAAGLPEEQREYEEQRKYVEDGVRAYARDVRDADGDGHFLQSFDDGFRQRRALYLLLTLDDFTSTLDEPRRAAFRPLRRALWTALESVRALSWRVFDEDPTTGALVRQLQGQRGTTLSAAVRTLLRTLDAKLNEGLQKIRKDTRAACEDIETAISDLKRQDIPARFPPHPFSAIFDRYEIRDMLILPVDLLADLGERQVIGFIRISPQAATYVQKAPADKLSGDALGHFGGFLNSEWRANDVLWGRVDAAEVIMRVVLEGQPADVVERHIRAAQEAITRDELPLVWQETPNLNYKAYLEREHRVGEQSLADLAPEQKAPLAMRAGWVVRNMLRGLEQRGAGQEGKADVPAPLRAMFGYLGKGLGTVLGLVQWPATAIWGRDVLVRRAVTLLLLFLFGWAVLLVVTMLLGMIEPNGATYRLTALLAAPFLIWVMLLNRRYGTLLIAVLVIALGRLGWPAFLAWLRAAIR